MPNKIIYLFQSFYRVSGSWKKEIAKAIFPSLSLAVFGTLLSSLVAVDYEHSRVIWGINNARVFYEELLWFVIVVAVIQALFLYVGEAIMLLFRKFYGLAYTDRNFVLLFSHVSFVISSIIYFLLYIKGDNLSETSLIILIWIIFPWLSSILGFFTQVLFEIGARKRRK